MAKTESRKLSARLAAVLLLALPFSASAADSKSTVMVDVTNQNGKPVDNATVILDFLGSHQMTKLGKRKAVHWEVHTNQQGKAHFPPVPYGTVQLQVVTTKYQTYGKKVELDAEEKRVAIQLEPPQSQYSAHPALKPADPKP